MQEVADSRQQTEEQLRELRRREGTVLDAILANDGSMKAKIIELAKIMEDRINLLDPMISFAVHEISTQIARVLRSAPEPSPIADIVYQYLPDKYKNPDQAKWGKLGKVAQMLKEGQVELGERIEKCSINELETHLEAKQKARNELDKAITVLNNDIEDIRREAVRRGIEQLGDEKIRDQISERDYRYDIPEYFGLAELNEEVTKQGNRWIKALDVFFNKKYPDRPGHIRQEVYKWANAIRVIANVHEVINEDKWSGDLTFWFDREYHAKIQSKHDAGNSTMWPTTLCASCSKDVGEDPKDCVKMKYWRPSPTRHICPMCGGTKIKLRENTREQVGDKEADVYRDASDVLNHIPFYADVFIQYVMHDKSPPIYSRKDAIKVPFSKSAIGGVDKIVVPRKKTKG